MPRSSFRHPLATILLLVATLVICGCKNSHPTEPVVAQIGDTFITETEFMDGYRKQILKTGVQDSERERRRYLDGLVNKRLLTIYAEKEGMYDRRAEEDALARIRDKLLVDAYTAQVVYDDVRITDADMREMFVRMNTSITARHLYSRTLEGAQALETRLQSGETFEDLAREIFADSVLANSGGSVGTFEFDEMDPAFEEAAFELDVGAISAPVRTSTGYSIIQVQDRFTNPMIRESEFAERRDRIAGYVRYRKRIAARSEHVRAIVDGLNVVYHEPTFSELLARITGDSYAARGENLELGPSSLVSFGPGDARRTWTVDEFRKEAARTSPEQRASVEDGATLRQFIEGLLVRNEMIERARERGLHESNAFGDAFEAAREDWIYEQFRDTFRASIDVPEDSVKEYYERTKDEFTIPEKVRVWEILLQSKHEADAVLEMTASRSFASLAGEYSIREGASIAGGDLGYVARDQLGILADRVFSASEGQIIGPVEIAGRYALVKVGDRLPPRKAELEEVYQEVERRLVSERERGKLIDEINRMRNLLDINIHWKTLYSAPLK